jgi:hypothetical protein
MAVRVDTPIVAPAPAPRPRSRWLLVALVIAVVLLAAFAAYLLDYQPLAPGNAFGVIGMTDGHHGRRGLSPGDVGGEIPVAYRQGEEVDLVFDVTNSGPFGATFTESLKTRKKSFPSRS